jgi:mono/diheme cytochrome c family protein
MRRQSVLEATERRNARRVAGALALASIASGLVGCESQEEYRLRVAQNFFDDKCGRCHGSSRGEGPQWVEDFGGEAPDLRELWRHYGTPLPHDELAALIDGRTDVAAHGPRAMPVWGETLYEGFPESGSVEEMRAGTIDMLIDYLQTVQTAEGMPHAEPDEPREAS